MFDYKRLSFVFLFLIVFLFATDTNIERQIRKSLLSFFDIVVEESEMVSDTAPSSLIDTAEDARIGIYNFFGKQATNLSDQADAKSGPIAILLSISSYVLYILKFITNYVITFYPFLIFLLYTFFTSSFFRRDDFGYDNY